MRAKKDKQPSKELTVFLANTPLGHVILTFTPKGLTALDFAEEESTISLGPPPPATWMPS